LLDAMATLTGPRIADLADVDPILGPGRRLARTWLEMIIKFRRAGQRTCRPRTRRIESGLAHLTVLERRVGDLAHPRVGYQRPATYLSRHC
jgi:hypothetical protein